jgi:glycosyltransferase involved in cell wall biosynthesis
MYKNKKIVVVMPAYNAERTLEKTHAEVMDQGIVDLVVIVDDKSHDQTTTIAAGLSNAKLIRHEKNRGYGGNQKTCYRVALEEGADIVIMVHPDYQYTPLLIPAMASLIGNGLYHCVLGSRILGGIALKSGMPWWRYFSNRILTLFQNILLGAKLSEYHSGYRAFSRELLEKIPFEENSEDFVFDNQILVQIHWLGYVIAEITCPTKYFEGASSIGFSRSVKYGLGCVAGALKFRLAKAGLLPPLVSR